ncbi:MFS transporter [Catelliglobosispora koreensis]|uniref:MFS transporter n=1 Tax=Catelliglobosispora koreensis TaxID=129052 RepID=UPI00035E5603|nr:MFS transporter [Catelliglobosispora koreensis]
MTIDFRWLWLGETTSKLGSSISSVAIPLVAVTVLNASTFEVGMLTAASWLPWLLVGLPAGAWVDRLRRRPLMLACNAASALLLLFVPIAAVAGFLTVGLLLAVALLMGTANVFFQTAYQVFIPALLSKEELPKGNAKLQGSESAAHVAGPGLAGLIAQSAGALGGLIADAASFVISTVCLLRIRGGEAAIEPRELNLRRDIKEGWSFLARDPYLRVFTVGGALSNLVLTGYQTILVVFLIREVGVTPGGVGALLMSMSVGGVLGAMSASRITARFGTSHGMLLTLFLTSPFAILIPLTGQGWRLGFVIAGGFMVGAGVVVNNIIRSSFRQSYVPREMLGRVTVSMMFLNFGTIPLGGLIGGFLGEAVGVRPTLWIMTTAVAMAPLVLLLGPMRTGRDLPVTALP